MPLGQSGQDGPDRVSSAVLVSLLLLLEMEETRMALQTRLLDCDVDGMDDFM